MKRLLCIVLALILLIGLVGCGTTEESPAPQTPTNPEDYVPLEPLSYTELPTALKAEKMGTISREGIVPSAGGLYYQDGELFGIMTSDGKVDSGAVYSLCQPRDKYFIVAKETGDMADVASANVVGLVDATGREIIPMEYASVELLGERFARVAELTGVTEDAAEKLTQFADGDKTVMCTGVWYLYDLQTGEKVPNATGTKPYISFDCGGYVKYVTDEKVTVTATPDGKVIPNDVVHLNNGHYADAKKHTVYDSDGNPLFTYDTEDYVPVDSKGFDDYILAQKKVKGKDAYVLLDATGKAVSAVFEQKPIQVGTLFHVGNQLVTLQGDPVVENGCALVFGEALYGQSWTVIGGKTTRVVDKNGNTVFEDKTTGSVVDNAQMMCYKQGTGTRYYYSRKDKGFTISGIGVAPFVVKKANGATHYDLINVLTGEVILGGYSDYTISDAGKTMMYVYAKNGEGKIDVFAIR